MLAEKRYEQIINLVNEKNSITVIELCGKTNTSESTIRRDIIYLDQKGLLNKVHGGATSINMLYNNNERDLFERKELNIKEKTSLAKYAASLIEDEDFVFLDAGSTTEFMIDFITANNITVVTSGLSQAVKCSKQGIKTIILGGTLKPITECVTGVEACKMLNMYNFTKGFFGANGISVDSGYTTPETTEAMIKKEAINRCAKAYIVADKTKIDVICPIKFADFEECYLITENLNNEKYNGLNNVKQIEV